MKKMKNIAESKITVFIKPKEPFLLSASRDLVTFSFMALCIYISQGSNFWTFMSGGLFIFYGSAKLKGILENHSNCFTSKDAAIEYIKKSDLGE